MADLFDYASEAAAMRSSLPVSQERLRVLGLDVMPTGSLLVAAGGYDNPEAVCASCLRSLAECRVAWDEPNATLQPSRWDGKTICATCEFDRDEENA